MGGDPSVTLRSPTERVGLESLRQDAEAIFRAGVAAADPERAVRAHLIRDGDQLSLGSESVAVDSVSRWILLGAGKASVPMARAVEALLPTDALVGCVATLPGADTRTLRTETFAAPHPFPTDDTVAGTQRTLRIAAEATATDHAIVVLSGGASAMWTLPAEGLTRFQLQRTADLLMKAGANIHELNTVRRHLSEIKGGGLARYLAPTPTWVLYVSDVSGDDLSTLASGPLVADRSTARDALRVLDEREIRSRVPQAVVAHLEARSATPRAAQSVDPHPHVHGRLVANLAIAAEGAAAEATRLGYHTDILSLGISGEARLAAQDVVRRALTERPSRRERSCCLFGGETTVTVRGTGVGGRNQELALSAARLLDGDEDVVLLAAGTDGIDGPTDAAGAIVDGDTAERLEDAGIDPKAALDNNDSGRALAEVGCRVKTGPTGTNVSDLIVVLFDA